MSNYCCLSLHDSQYASTRWQKIILQLRDKQQLLLFVFTRRSVCQYSITEDNPAAQRQTAVTAYLKCKQLLLFAFARLSVCQYSMSEENLAAQRQTAVTAYLTCKQLLLFAFASQCLSLAHSTSQISMWKPPKIARRLAKYRPPDADSIWVDGSVCDQNIMCYFWKQYITFH